VRTDFDIANDLKGANLLTYREIGGGIRVRPEIVKFVRDQGLRKIIPEVYGLIFRGKIFRITQISDELGIYGWARCYFDAFCSQYTATLTSSV